MAKLVPLLLVLAGVALAGVMLFGDDDPGDTALDVRDAWDEDESTPALRTSEAAGTGASPRDAPAQPEASPSAGTAPRGAVRWLTGVVLDAASGAPIAGARLVGEAAGRPCPRLPGAVRAHLPATQGGAFDPLHGGPTTALLGSATTDAEGRFTWTVGDVRTLASRFDVFVSAAGYIDDVACAPQVGDELTIRLRKAVAVEVEVTDPAGRPIEGARLVVGPAGETPAIPGYGGMGFTDENGRGRVEGLRPGSAKANEQVVVHVDHPAWMPTTSAPFAPALAPRQTLRLTPALRLALRLRSDDGTAIRNPSLAWRTDGRLAHEGLLLLAVSPNGPEGEPEAEVLAEAVRIPCDARTVALEVKAIGFTSWRQKEPLPAGGGEREVIAVLTRDTDLGSLTVRYETADGEAVPYHELGGAQVEITHLGGVDIGPVTLSGGEVLSLPSLPAGRYRITKRSPAYAPATVEVDVRPGEANEATARLGPPAKLRVRFRSDVAGMVEFRLLQGGVPVPGFSTTDDGEPGAEGLRTAGGDGALFTGLPSGAFVLEVVSPEYTAAAHTVNLAEGRTTEVEIEVRAR